MRWTTDLATGNDVVDSEHRELIALINRLELAGSGPDGMGIASALRGSDRLRLRSLSDGREAHAARGVSYRRLRSPHR